METDALRCLLLLFIAGVGQTALLAFVVAFLARISLRQTYSPAWSTVSFMIRYSSETTLIFSLIATLLSVMTTLFFGIAVKEALRYRLHHRISLIKMAGGIALAKSGFVANRRHWRTTLFTIAMFGLTKLMVSSWSTLVIPTIVAQNIPVTGSELDLSSSYFDSLLGQQIYSVNSENLITIIGTQGLMSGIVAAQYSFGMRGILNFNAVAYNISTGGILPAATGFLGPDQPVQPNNTGLSFAGGQVLTNLGPVSQGILSNFTLQQQGLTADVTCAQVAQDSMNATITPLNATSSFVSLVECSMLCEGAQTEQGLVIQTSQTTGALCALTCPSTAQSSGQSSPDRSTLNVTMQGFGRYDFLQLINCEIVPKFTTSQVIYASSGTLDVTVLDSTPLTSNNTNLEYCLTLIMAYLTENSQSLTSNSIGDALYSIASAANVNTTNASGQIDPRLLNELEQYWRGIVEFLGTYLRSGFTASPTIVLANGATSLNGTNVITTMGWTRRSAVYIYTLVPVAIFTLLTYAAIGYVLWHRFEKVTSTFTRFDVTNPVHLIMVSSTRVSNGKQNLEGEVASEPNEKPSSKRETPFVSDENQNLEGERLAGFDKGGIDENDEVEVELVDVDTDGVPRKRFRNVTPAKRNDP